MKSPLIIANTGNRIIRLSHASPSGGWLSLEYIVIEGDVIRKEIRLKRSEAIELMRALALATKKENGENEKPEDE